MSQIAKKRFPIAILLGGLSVNLNHLKSRKGKFLTRAGCGGYQVSFAFWTFENIYQFDLIHPIYPFKALHFYLVAHLFYSNGS